MFSLATPKSLKIPTGKSRIITDFKKVLKTFSDLKHNESLTVFEIKQVLLKKKHEHTIESIGIKTHI